MGFIAEAVAAAEHSGDSEAAVTTDIGDNPFLSPDTFDPLISRFDTAKIDLTKEDLALWLSLVVLVSKILGD